MKRREIIMIISSITVIIIRTLNEEEMAVDWCCWRLLFLFFFGRHHQVESTIHALIYVATQATNSAHAPLLFLFSSFSFYHWICMYQRIYIFMHTRFERQQEQHQQQQQHQQQGKATGWK